MRTLSFIISILFLFTGIFGNAQMTPEQKKKQEEVQEKAEEAYKKAMEMMQNNPQMKAMIKQMEAQEANKKADRKKNEATAEKENAIKHAKHLEEYYWRNKVASNTNGKFSNWKRGDVQIAYYNGKGKRDKDFNLLIEDYVVVGRINNDGVVTMNLPQTVKANMVISKGLFPEMHDIFNGDVTFSNPEAPFLWSGFGLYVLQGDKSIGSLYMGNSERATDNLASPTGMKYGDEGYLLYWAYSKEACEAIYTKDDKNREIYDGELSKVVDQYTRCNLEFKPGWNLVKIEVKGNHPIGNHSRWKNKDYTIVTGMPTDARYYFSYEDQKN